MALTSALACSTVAYAFPVTVWCTISFLVGTYDGGHNSWPPEKRKLSSAPQTSRRNVIGFAVTAAGVTLAFRGESSAAEAKLAPGSDETTVDTPEIFNVGSWPAMVTL